MKKFIRFDKIFIVIATLFIFSACAICMTKEQQTHKSIVEMRNGESIEYVLPIEVPAIEQLTEVANFYHVGNQICSGNMFYIDTAEGDVHANMFIVDKLTQRLLGVMQFVYVGDTYEIESESFWIYEEFNIPVKVSRAVAAEFLNQTCQDLVLKPERAK